MELHTCDHQSFFDYWHSLPKGASGVPMRRSISPKGFPKLLPFYYFLERHAHENVVMRLWGTALDAFFPNLKTGENLFNAYPDEQRPFYAEVIRLSCAHPCGYRLTRVISLTNGTEMTLQTSGMPVAAEDGDIRYIAGVSDTPNAGLMLGLESGAKRRGATMVAIEYLDVGFGVPADVPAFPPGSREA